ncbi:flippase-like domain-containing protein [Streptomyces lunaelactis]|nr:flippase-like domain-containing protein [Streptomyces lunaelactis]NUK07630.1 flippase-like domain-containing protein [Streptomyces lunaelactis]NUK24933.1 flippase-like domain-containing protein [Streptomyces lunaelactis]NUK36711.1 flippase-like domain-containing protein [Streptomyces lunaelactis]NUK43152.1 flippase-like domain-containing protein [Streptomyces lunaelactis]
MSGRTRARIGTIAGVGILAVLVWRLGTGAFLDGLRRIDGPTLLAALGLGLLTTVFSAWRWRIVARGLGIRLPLGSAVADYYRALFLNAALPGGVLGDVHRAVRHGQSTGDIGRGVRAVVLERTAGQLVLIAVGVTVLIAGPNPALAGIRPLATSPVIALTVAVIGALMIAAAVRLGRKPDASRWRRAVRSALAEARLGLLSRSSWPGVVLSSVVVLAGHLGTFLLAARAAGATAQTAELVPLMVLALLAMALPLNVGGWGPREGVTAWAFGAAGLGAAQGLTVAVVYGVLTFAASLPGAGVLAGQWLVGQNLRRPQLKLEERVLAEGGASHRRAQRVPHHRLSGESEPGDSVAEQDRRHGDVQPVQRTLLQEPRHGDTAALDQHPAQAAPRQRLHQAARGEVVAVREYQHIDAVGHGLATLAAGAHHPQSRG